MSDLPAPAHPPTLDPELVDVQLRELEHQRNSAHTRCVALAIENARLARAWQAASAITKQQQDELAGLRRELAVLKASSAEALGTSVGPSIN